MAYYAGIDLGTTNSAIATWDGSTLKLWKSPEQNDVTPSAIYFDRRGRYVGKRAYDLAPQDRSKSATLFKRLMGTSTPINVSGQDPLTPEWRSEEHTSELQSLMRISYAVFCLKKKNKTIHIYDNTTTRIV